MRLAVGMAIAGAVVGATGLVVGMWAVHSMRTWKAVHREGFVVHADDLHLRRMSRPA